MDLRSLPRGVVAPTGPRDIVHSPKSKAALANRSKCPSYDAYRSRSVRHEGIADLGWLDLCRRHAGRARPRCSFGQAAMPARLLASKLEASEQQQHGQQGKRPFSASPPLETTSVLGTVSPTHRHSRRHRHSAKPSPLRVPSLATLSLPGGLSSDPSSESQRLRASKIPHVSPSNLGDGAIPGGRHTRHQQHRPQSSSPGRACEDAE